MGYQLLQRQELKMTQALRQEVRLHIDLLRMNLVGILRDEDYRPQAQCSRCGRHLSPGEILKGFKDDPRDFTTECPQCKARFAPSIICFGDGTKITLPFYCSVQTVDQLRGKESLSPAEIAHRHPGIYRSAIAHHGGLVQAFAEIDIDYPFKEEFHGWKNKVRPFLGRMTDVMIADLVRVSTSTIRKMRHELGIPRFTMADAAGEL